MTSTTSRRAATASTTTTTPLRSPQVRKIVAAYTVNRLGTWFGFIALSVAVFDHTHSAVAVAALLLAGQVLPAFLTPALVARVEASSGKGELGGLYLFEAAASAALAALLLWHFWLPAVLLLVALDGTAALAASALLRAALARCARDWSDARNEDVTAAQAHFSAHTYAGQLPDENRAEGARATGSAGDAREAAAVEAERKANAALNIGFAITFTLGPALAGLVVPALGAPAALLIDMASFIACGAMMIDFTPHVEDAETASVRARLHDAWQYINTVKALRALLLVQAVALVFFEFSPPIEVAYAKVSLHAGAGGYGLLLGVWGLGAAIGSIVFARSLERSLGILLSASTLAVGVAYLGWAVAPSLAIACVPGLIGGIGNGVQLAALISAVQQLTAPSLQGRLMGAVESIGAICPGVGFLLGGGIAAVGSPRDAFLVAGIGASVSTVAFVRITLGSLTQASAAGTDTTADAEPTGQARAPIVGPASVTPPWSDPAPYEQTAVPGLGAEQERSGDRTGGVQRASGTGGAP